MHLQERVDAPVPPPSAQWPGHVGGDDHTATPIARRPVDLDATGLNENFVADLVLKHLYRGGVLNITQLTERLALAGSMLEPILVFLRNESCLEVLPAKQHGARRYSLTDRGRRHAAEAMVQSGYVGAAPVTLEDYRRVVEAQSVRALKVTRDQARKAFADVVAAPTLIDQLGIALNSGRAVFLYGPAGTGKTFLGSRMVRMLPDSILVPHALLVDDRVIQFFNPRVHRRVDKHAGPGLMLNEGHDPRFVRCRRPEVVTGGELTLDMLEVQYDAAANLYHGPNQLIANNGLYLIDDLGRQRMSPDALLNRWITPMEEGRDFLSVGGARFEVPFDVILIFSTNMKPLDLADEAFLRRLGHKVPFAYIDAEQYRLIWRNTCDGLGLEFEPDQVRHVLDRYAAEDRPLLPCHPRDILNNLADKLDYESSTRVSAITVDGLDVAWNSYFVPLDNGPGHQLEGSEDEV